ncbi:MAG: hypothetical protein IPL98_03200 [Saprospiraceae bacterium]|nr:hypothetical protein [Saprospiraceae bacterium]
MKIKFLFSPQRHSATAPQRHSATLFFAKIRYLTILAVFSFLCMSTQISAQPCQSYVLSLGQPVRDCAGPMGKVRVPVFVTWSSQAEINCFDLDIQVLFQFNTGNFEFSMFETKASLSPILMNSSSWFQFELINNSSSTQTFRMSGIPSTPQAPNPHLPRIQFPHTPLDAIHLLDLVYSNNEKLE